MFEMYPARHELNIFRYAEYGALLSAVRELKPTSMLEFGPGVSTVALLEAGCDKIVTCEYDRRWLARMRRKLGRYRNVKVVHYYNRVDRVVPTIGDDEMFDAAFVDSPIGQGGRRVRFEGDGDKSRLHTTDFALLHASVVFLHDAKREGEQRTLEEIDRRGGFKIDIIDTPKGIARIARV